MNLGSPDSTSVEDVKRYLKEFLMDERVIDYPYWFRFLLMKGIVIPRRAPQSAEAYKKIWWKEGSPLVVLTHRIAEEVSLVAGIPVFATMRYGSPSPRNVYDHIKMFYPYVKHVKVIPMYPHYTMSSFETAVIHARRHFDQGDYPFSLSFQSPFYNNADYIGALCSSIRPFLNRSFDKIVFSYHGVPERHLQKDKAHIEKNKDNILSYISPPKLSYRDQCIETTSLVQQHLNLPPEVCLTSFQSRLTAAGPQWIQPYTAPLLTDLPNSGVKKILIVCPAFVTDCLETLEEIAIQGEELFSNAGGEQYTFVSCMNSDPRWIKVLSKWAVE